MCGRTNDVQRFHDGELPAAERAALEAHIRDCAPCGALLAELRGLSAALLTAGLQVPSAQALRRIEQTWKIARDRGVIRLAGWLTAAAAAVLLVVLIGQPNAGRVEVVESTAIWELAAVTPPADTDDDRNSDLLALASWMAEDLSATSRQ